MPSFYARELGATDFMTTRKLVRNDTSPNSRPKPPSIFCRSDLDIVNVISSETAGAVRIEEVVSVEVDGDRCLYDASVEGLAKDVVSSVMAACALVVDGAMIDAAARTCCINFLLGS